MASQERPDRPERLTELHRLLDGALELADSLKIDLVAIRISEALERVREERANVPSRRDRPSAPDVKIVPVDGAMSNRRELRE